MADLTFEGLGSIHTGYFQEKRRYQRIPYMKCLRGKQVRNQAVRLPINSYINKILWTRILYQDQKRFTLDTESINAS